MIALLRWFGFVVTDVTHVGRYRLLNGYVTPLPFPHFIVYTLTGARLRFRLLVTVHHTHCSPFAVVWFTPGLPHTHVSYYTDLWTHVTLWTHTVVTPQLRPQLRAFVYTRGQLVAVAHRTRCAPRHTFTVAVAATHVTQDLIGFHTHVHARGTHTLVGLHQHTFYS